MSKRIKIKLGTSIKIKLFAVICAIAVAFVGVLTVLNLFFYKDYYLLERRHALINIYKSVNSSYAGMSSDVSSMLEQMENTSAARFSILDADGQVQYDSFYREHHILNSALTNDTTTGESTVGGASTGDSQNNKQINSDLILTQNVLAAADKSELAEQGYTFTTTRMDPHGDGMGGGGSGFDFGKLPIDEFLCLVGNLGTDGEMLIVRIPMAYMEQNTSFNSTFLLIAGMLTLLLCIGLAYLVSRHFTRPLIEIEEVATAMADLNFNKTYTGTSRDEIGRLGHSINRLSEHLERAIVDLKRTNEELAHEIDEKERIDSMRREFIVNVSHELKTPIALIQGYAEGLRVGVTDNQADREYYCDIIVDESRRMNQLVMQLLDLSKLELGRERPDPVEVELYPLCTSVVQKFALLREEREQTIDYENCHESMYVDYGMMQQVVTNYLSNAIRYTPVGGRIAAYAQRQEDGTVCLCVENEGEAIAEEELDLIFEKFYRTDKARSRESGGTGIGLSIVRAIAEAHGGACGAENIEGGVRFWFRVPSAPMLKEETE